jgi:DNA-binding beta-propeller fold protein YncE
MSLSKIASAALSAVTISATLAGAQTFSVQKYSIGGEGGSDYITAEQGTGRVFIPRGTHVMVIDGATGKVIGDIPDTPRTHGVAIAPKSNHGFITAAGDSSVTMFDLKTLAPIKKIKIPTGGLDGIGYDAFSDRIILGNHSRPVGTAVAIDPNSGTIVSTTNLDDNGPEGIVGDGKGRVFINLEGKNAIQVLDAKTMKVLALWPIAPCDGPTGLGIDTQTSRLFVGCSKMSVIVDAASGKVVDSVANGDGVDALGFDPAQKLIYIPAGRDGNVTVVHEDTPDKYTVVATVATMRGARTLSVDPVTHAAYLINPEYGPAPTPAPGSPPPAPGTRPPRGPVVAAWLFAITH